MSGAAAPSEQSDGTKRQGHERCRLGRGKDHGLSADVVDVIPEVDFEKLGLALTMPVAMALHRRDRRLNDRRHDDSGDALIERDRVDEEVKGGRIASG